jgi:hypothetical protein
MDLDVPDSIVAEVGVIGIQRQIFQTVDDAYAEYCARTYGHSPKRLCYLCRYNSRIVDSGAHGTGLWSEMMRMVDEFWDTSSPQEIMRLIEDYVNHTMRDALIDCRPPVVMPPFDAAYVWEHLGSMQHSVGSRRFVVNTLRKMERIACVAEDRIFLQGTTDYKAMAEVRHYYMDMWKIHKETNPARMAFGSARAHDINPRNEGHLTSANALQRMAREQPAFVSRFVREHHERLLVAANNTDQ